jgi:hypothetical protein
VSVTPRPPGESVAFHDALKTFPLRGPYDLDPISRLEKLDGQLLSGLEGFVSREFEFAQNTRGVVQTDSGGMTELRAAAPRLLFAAETELDGCIAVLVGILDLYHRTRSGLDDRDGNRRPFVVEEPGHPELTSNESRHRLRPSLPVQLSPP